VRINQKKAEKGSAIFIFCRVSGLDMGPRLGAMVRAMVGASTRAEYASKRVKVMIKIRCLQWVYNDVFWVKSGIVMSRGRAPGGYS
jgi:hypothetical protein